MACSPLVSPFACCPARPKRTGSRWPRAGPVRARRPTRTPGAAGIIREAVWIQPAPGGDIAVVYLEADDLATAFTIVGTSAEPFDVTGHPAMSVPVGDSDGLPVGMMLAGRHGEDATILRVAHAFEKSR